MQGKQNQPDAV